MTDDRDRADRLHRELRELGLRMTKHGRSGRRWWACLSPESGAVVCGKGVSLLDAIENGIAALRGRPKPSSSPRRSRRGN